ncbi:hypothetical protein M9H77_08197 [Catharanthus roseus]|uniref:Uncharacterized protein n=1 Tax=Catharanthus roseus TaxID=4058 RepID=A0ACC0BXC6_CATRO|nr:hypothetical protein M9H77_08197 [Catharanthus roseus]
MVSFQDVAGSAPSRPWQHHCRMRLVVKLPSQFKGESAVFFDKKEINSLAEPFNLSLIGKFSHGRPSLDNLRWEFHTFGFKGSFTIGWLDSRHVLIRFDLEEDYIRLWLKGSWSLQGYLMRVFKWSVDFQLSAEPSVIPGWIALEGLPIHLFNKGSMFSIANLIGKPMKIDEPAANLSRPSVARICVEMDLLKELPSRIWIGIGDLPPYCSYCKKIGHDASEYQKLLLSKSLGREGVDHIAPGNEQKQQEAPTLSGKTKRITWATKDKLLSDTTAMLPQHSTSTGNLTAP